jgi:hypothetical protein
MTITVNQRTYVGISSLLMKRKSDNVVLTWPVPNTFVLNTNIEQRIQEGRNSQGRKVRTGSYVTGEMPELTISYSYIQPEMISFNTGNQQASGTFGTFIPRLLEVSRDSYAADATGFLLDGVAADAAGATASVTRLGVSVALNRQPFATFDGTSPANDDSFAIGADGALLFSDNLVTNRDVVAILIPNTVTGIKLSDVLVGPHELYATMIDTRNKVSVFEALNVTPNIEGRTLDFGGEGMEISLFVNNLPGECRAWNVLNTELSVNCL